MILPAGPLEALVGKNVTFTTLVDKPVYSFIVWNFNNGHEQIHIATVSDKGLKVNTPYTGRVNINATNGFLTLTGVKTVDSGEYNINIIDPDGGTKTGEIELQVLGESLFAYTIALLHDPVLCTKFQNKCRIKENEYPELQIMLLFKISGSICLLNALNTKLQIFQMRSVF